MHRESVALDSSDLRIRRKSGRAIQRCLYTRAVDFIFWEKP